MRKFELAICLCFIVAILASCAWDATNARIETSVLKISQDLSANGANSAYWPHDSGMADFGDVIVRTLENAPRAGYIQKPYGPMKFYNSDTQGWFYLE